MSVVTIYSDQNYGGQQLSLGYGNYAKLTDLGFCNKCISSMKIAPYTKVTVYPSEGLVGEQWPIVNSNPASRTDIPAFGSMADNNIGSIKIEKIAKPKSKSTTKPKTTPVSTPAVAPWYANGAFLFLVFVFVCIMAYVYRRFVRRNVRRNVQKTNTKP